MRPLFIIRLAFLALTLPLAQAAETASEYAVKAAFIYNFISFTTWPEPAPLHPRLCVLGRDPFGPALDNLAGKEALGGRLEVRRLSTDESTPGCLVLFISDSERANLATILEKLEGAAVLTVTDLPEAAAKGVIIKLALEGQKVVFRVDNEAARRARIQLSSKLLRLAREVH